MKIAYVYDVIYPFVMGGVQKRVWEIARRMAAKGHDVTVFGMKHWEGSNILYREGVRLYGVCPPQPLSDENRRLIREAIYFAWKVLPPLLKENFDIIDCQNFPYFPCFSAKIASVIKKSNLTITWHEYWGGYWLEYLGWKGIFGKYVETITQYLCSKVIAVSEMTKIKLEQNIYMGEIKVIPNGVDFQDIGRARRTGDIADILYVGRLSKEKHVDLLVKSIHCIKKIKPDIKCIIIGDGPQKLNIVNLIQMLKLENDITLISRVNESTEIFSYMKSSKLFVTLSTREGFGIVALEAMACGLPVVIVNHPQNALTELVTNGENGMICELSEMDVANNIIHCINNRIIMEQTCIRFATKYDWDNITDMTESFYTTV